VFDLAIFDMQWTMALCIFIPARCLLCLFHYSYQIWKKKCVCIMSMPCWNSNITQGGNLFYLSQYTLHLFFVEIVRCSNDCCIFFIYITYYEVNFHKSPPFLAGYHPPQLVSWHRGMLCEESSWINTRPIA
jgi:hypothetical protein